MISYRNLLNIVIVIFFSLFLFSCTKIRESAGVTRKSLDEFQAVENPALIIPPDLSLVPPDQIEKKNIDDIEKELAKEILFGLEEKNQNINNNSSTMSNILDKTKASEFSDDIRNSINEEFSNEKKSKSVFQATWEDETEVLDAIKESERIREKNFSGESIANDEVPIKIDKRKIKKKKRFWFF